MYRRVLTSASGATPDTGRFEPTSLTAMITSIREVAEAASVSIATVSNVLNRPHLVADVTAQRVHSAIRSTGYVPNASARQLRTGTAPIVNVVVPDIANPFFAELASGVQRAASVHGLTVLIANTEGDEERERQYIRTIMEHRPTGVLITPSAADEGALDALSERVPIVLVDRHSEGSHCSVAVDDVHGASEAVDHLHALGHHRITWIVGPQSIPQCAERSRGVADGARRHGVEVTTMSVDHMTVSEGRIAGARLLDAPLPTAVLCANDLLALGAQFALLGAQVSIPDQVSIVGFDDIEFGASAAVPLTSVARPGAGLGSASLELLLTEAGDNDHRHQQVRFNPHLTVRRSSGRARED